MTDLGKVDQGILRASIDYRVEEKNGKVIGTVFSSAPYAQWVEFGRRGTRKDLTGGNPNVATAAWPPVAVIRAWVARHYRDFAPLGRTKAGRVRARTKTNSASFDKKIASLAFLVGRKIYRDGIKPSPFMIPTFLVWAKRLKTIVGDAVQARKAQL